ncbi:MAG: DUF2622 domain-containing protein [Proteobacteria bacterium]|nr:DUF2622 domain-containing protein [Pseudomonadota bacterium]
MANFVVRIELHDATWQDYQKLHQAMELSGFSRTIVGADGIHYELPPAEYHFPESGLNGVQVHDRAKAVANSTGRINTIVVTESKGITFSGLRPVHPAANVGLRRFG